MAGESDSGLTGSKPYFFLSYARTPKRDPADREDPDRWVHKLYKDLCAAILQMTEAQPEEAGFMDRENQLGTEWSPELARALASCRVFVPLYSRRYFESDNCGKEWFAFARREVNQNARGDQIVSAIVPALWARLDQDRIPDVAQPIQYHHVNLGPRYSTEGFYGIMKLQKYRADYLLAVHRLAERIVQVADETSIHVERPAEYESLQSAFGPASAQRSAADQLRISVLAHDTSTLPPGRADHYTAAPRIPGVRTGRITRSRWPTTRGIWPRNAWAASRWWGPLRIRRAGLATGGRCPRACASSTPG